MSAGRDGIPAKQTGTSHFYHSRTPYFPRNSEAKTDIFAGRSIQFSGTYEPEGNSYLAVYGWMLDPRIEYYIVENHGTYDPNVAIQNLGTATCDGSEYDIGIVVRISPGLDPRLYQYWSIRREKRSEGVVTTGCHFDAWRDAGLEFGRHHFQIVATEGYFSSGFAEIIVADVS